MKAGAKMPKGSTASGQTLYELLGVPRSATQAQIETAYSELVEKCLRDSDSSLSRLVQLHAAYDVLADEAKRAKYDAELLQEERAGETHGKQGHFDPAQGAYKILGVNPGASAAEIKAAYRCLAKQYHPDLNHAPDAPVRMRQINAAYDILSDPAQRAAYDASLRTEPVTPRPREARGERQQEGTGQAGMADSFTYAQRFAQEMRCQGCGRFDHTIRAVAFPSVLSLLIVSSKRYHSGIFCQRCRSQKSLRAAVMSLLFGPWGLPWGIIWTLQAIAANYREGQAPKAANQGLLRQIAWVNVTLGRIGEAKAALRDLLRYGKDLDAERFRKELDSAYPTIGLAKRASTPRLGFIMVLLAILAVYGAVGYAVSGGSSKDTTPANTPSSQSGSTSSLPTTITPTSPSDKSHSVSQTPPDNSFVVWQDSSEVVGSTIYVTGTVNNTHAQWSITNTYVYVKRYPNFTVQSVAVTPSSIGPGGTGTYSGFYNLIANDTGLGYSVGLTWEWVPPK